MTALTPGVMVEERLSPARTPANPHSTVSALVGPIPRGPADVSVVHSWTEFMRWFGAFHSNNDLSYSAFNFFNNGGRTLYIGRVIGAGAETANRLFSSEGEEESLDVSALSPGEWGNELYVEFRTSVQSGTYDVFVYHKGASPAYLVERFLAVTNDENEDRYVERIVNSPRTGSKLIRVEVRGETRPATTEEPEVLAGGLDGSEPDVDKFDSVFSQFDVIDNPVVMNLPGVSDTNILGQAVQHAESKGDLFVVADPPRNAEPQDVIDWSQSLAGSSYIAAYYPNVVFVDPSSQSRTSTRSSPPGGAILGQYARTDASRGVFKAPAGIDTRLSGAVALEYALDGRDLAALNAAHVNPLRHMPGAGITIHGARTLRITNQADRYVNVRRTLVYLKKAFKELFRFAEFESNDEVTWSMVRAEGNRFLRGFWQEGGLRGDSEDSAFFVKCDDELNDEAALEQGIMYIEIGVALQRPAEFIIVTLSQWAGGDSAIENF